MSVQGGEREGEREGERTFFFCKLLKKPLERNLCAEFLIVAPCLFFLRPISQKKKFEKKKKYNNYTENNCTNPVLKRKYGRSYGIISLVLRKNYVTFSIANPSTNVPDTSKEEKILQNCYCA